MLKERTFYKIVTFFLIILIIIPNLLEKIIEIT